MSTETSAEFVALALELLGDDGVPVAVTSRSPGSLSSSGDRAPPASPRLGTGIIFPSRGTTLVEGEARASERVVMTPVDPWPRPGELIEINGRSLTVGDDGTKTYAPQGIPIIHDLAVAS